MIGIRLISQSPYLSRNTLQALWRNWSKTMPFFVGKSRRNFAERDPTFLGRERGKGRNSTIGENLPKEWNKPR